jgi:hypothetical protein
MWRFSLFGGAKWTSGTPDREMSLLGVVTAPARMFAEGGLFAKWKRGEGGLS